jgi:hypothetical protein
VTETFEVGQKVKHYTRGDVEVSYGPYDSPFGGPRYVVKLDSGKETAVSPDTLTAIPVTPKFAVGDEVTLRTRGSKATVEYGPFDDRDVYVVKLVDEPTDPDGVRTFTALASVMQAVPEIKVGDRVRVVKDDPAIRTGEFVGKTGVVQGLNRRSSRLPFDVRFDAGQGAHYGSWNVAEVEPVTDENAHTHDGVTYDLTAKYKDRDSDTWHLAVIDGRLYGGTSWAPRDRHDGISVESILESWGPLTRVTT